MNDAVKPLPLYFREWTIPRGRISRRLSDGALVVVTNGVYMGLPGKDDEVWRDPQALADRINVTLARYAVRIAIRLIPTATLAYASAYRFGLGPDRYLSLVSQSTRTVVLGETLGDYLSDEVAALVKPVTLDVRRHRGVRDMRKAVDYLEVELDDGFEKDPQNLEHCADAGAMRRALAHVRIRVTTPRRTVLDICATGDEPGLVPQDKEYQALLQWAGLPHHGDDAPWRIEEAERQLRAEFPAMPPKAFERLGVRLRMLAERSDLVPQAELNRRGAREEFSLRWHGTPIGRLLQMRDDSLVFHYEDGWVLPIWREETNQRFPVFLANLFPEDIIKGSPLARVEFLRSHPRLMGNLTVVDVKKFGQRLPEDRLQYHLAEVCDDPCIYDGQVRGLPHFGPLFSAQTKHISQTGALTQLSGTQTKIPMYMGRDYLCPAVDCSFTHLLKFPNTAARQNIEIMEWFAMELSRAAGVDTAACRLVDLSMAVSGPLHPRLQEGLGEAPAHRDLQQEVRDQVAANKTLESGRVTDVLNADVFRRLSNAAAQAAEPDGEPVPTGYAALGLLVERFDIPSPGDPRWRMGEDFCSVSNRPDVNDNVKWTGTLEEVAALLKSCSTRWARDRLQLYRQVLISALVFNTDGHLKNFSVLRVASYDTSRWDEVRLSPAYDVVAATGVVPGQFWQQALPVCGTVTPGREEFLRFGETSCEIDRPEAEAILDEMIEATTAKAAELATEPPWLIARDPNLAAEVAWAERHVLTACMRLRRPGIVSRPGSGMAP